MTSGHVEVERKYDVDGGFVLPDPADLSAAGVAAADPHVEHELEAVYHDTSDLRLARARITLRRRTGGPDAGWHLKLPGTAGARRELHAPLGRATRKPPRALLEPIRGVLRGAPTGPVATLRNHRIVTVLRDGDGRALAEVADDTVTASASGPDGAAEVQAWREVEVELLDGDESLLAPVGDWLVAAGARPSDSASKLARVLSARLPAAPRRRRKKGPTAGEVVLTALRAQVDALQAADVALRTDGPDAVHQLRVAARRLRSILASFRPVLERAVTEPVRGELAWLGGELGQARDTEVALAHLREVVAEQPPELVLGPVAARLQQTALRSHLADREHALATLGGARYLALLNTLHALLDDPPLGPAAGDRAEPVLRAALRKAGRRLRRRIRTAERADGDARADDRDAALHGVRTAAKRVRYTAEVVALGPGTPPKPLLKTVKRAQKALGELQDTVVARAVCRRLAVEAVAAGENAFTFGLLHGLEEARADRARAAFAALEPDLLPTLRGALRS